MKNPALLSDETEELLRKLSERLADTLPGREAHLKLAPKVRLELMDFDPPEDAVSSSVMLLLYPDGSTLRTLVILRAEYDGVHSGQISLPGGKKENSDLNELSTALRETEEEIGLDPRLIRVLGNLSPFYISRSNYLVHPFIGYVENLPELHPDKNEVQQILSIAISDLWHPDTLITRELNFNNGISLKAPGYKVGDHFMWGATAMIFSEFIEIWNSIATP